MTRKVILDANILVSAAISRGPSHRIVSAWLESQPFELVICPAILAEALDVLNRPRVAKRLPPGFAGAFIRSIRIAADLVDDPPPGDEPITRDVKDDYLIRLARTHNVDVVVSGDKDLQEWDEQVPPVMAPAGFEVTITPPEASPEGG